MSDVNGSVIPLHFLGISDTELDQLSLDEQMKFALVNLTKKEGGYVIHHGQVLLSEFGIGQGNDPGPALNPLAAVYPVLFPYGIGRIEDKHEVMIGFDEHI